MQRFQSRSARRGNYAILCALSLTIILSFGALALDTSLLRLAHLQAQDVADAAASTALFVLRRTADTQEATRAVEAVLARNPILGSPATLTALDFGIWDDGRFFHEEVYPNAVQIEVAREGDNAIDLWLAKTMGIQKANVRAHATAATRSLQLIVVMDITGSWDWDDFEYARDAALLLHDNLLSAHGPDDMIGMTVFYNTYGYEWTPLTRLETVIGGELADQWSALGVSSKAGKRDDGYLDGSWKHPCRYNERFAKSQKDDYTYPSPAGEGGCFPNMPRWYTDENGTDHTVGIEMARQMFEENDIPGAYRAMIVLTDGEAADTRSYAGTTRTSQDYTEQRFREFHGSKRSVASIQDETIRLSQVMWDDLKVHTWMISFVANKTWMRSVPRGDGYYMLAEHPTELVEIFNEISQSLPIALVE